MFLVQPELESQKRQRKDEKEKFCDETIKGIFHNDSFESLLKAYTLRLASLSSLEDRQPKSFHFVKAFDGESSTHLERLLLKVHPKLLQRLTE